MPTPNAVDIAVELLKEFEGFRPWAYPDVASDLYRKHTDKKWGFESAIAIINSLPQEDQDLSGWPWTCGYGETRNVWKGTHWTKTEASERLAKRVTELHAALRAQLFQASEDPCMWGALLSLAYNIGTTAFLKSTLVKKLLKPDIQGAASEFLRWRFAQGKELPGLVKRRERERDVFLGKAK